jgi:hypothetical protein
MGSSFICRKISTFDVKRSEEIGRKVGRSPLQTKLSHNAVAISSRMPAQRDCQTRP